MTKNLFNWMLVAAVVCGLSLSVTSCKDDDDDKSPEEQEQEASQKASKFWDVVGQLVSSDDYTDDYQNATFESTYGIASDENPNVRIVATNSLEAAAQRFADLVGTDKVNASTPSFEWSDPEVGTLVYTRTNNGQSLATVDVNIKQLPRLQQIVYRTADQAGTNGSFQGMAYYRFGDVVKRIYNDKNDNNKQKSEYWICVRPAFGPAGKENSHWVSVSQPPVNNIFEHQGSNGVHYGLPKGIGTNKEHMQNFAELLFAITNPEAWSNNITQAIQKPKMWYDFDLGKHYAYHNKNFFTLVKDAWNTKEHGGKNLWELLLSYNDSEAAGNELTTQGLHLLYKGYSWWTKFSWNLTLYQASFTNGTGTESNMHKATYKDVENSAQNVKVGQMDLAAANYNETPYFSSNEFFNDGHRRYIIRHATGKELAGRQPDVCLPLASVNNDIEDVYVYNTKFNVPVGHDAEFKETTEDDVNSHIESVHPLDEPRLGCVLADDGNFYASDDAATENNATGIAIVVCLNGNKAVERGSNFNGLALAIKNSSRDDVKWVGTRTRYDNCTNLRTDSPGNYEYILDGLAMTDRLVSSACKDGHEHPAAQAVRNSAYPAALEAKGFSKWFLPSIGQWILALRASGVAYTNDGTFAMEGSGKLDQMFIDAGYNLYEPGYAGPQYWTTTERYYSSAYFVQLHSQTNLNTHRLLSCDKDRDQYARGMIAFRYGNYGDLEQPHQVDKYNDLYPPMPGYILSDFGLFYPTMADITDNRQKAIGLVVYADPFNDPVEKGTKYRGLAIALKDITGLWNMGEPYFYSSATKDMTALSTFKDGLARSGLADKGTIACSCIEFNSGGDDKDGVGKTFSTWFLPSIGQWILAANGLGNKWEGDHWATSDAQVFQSFQDAITKAGITDKQALLKEDAKGMYWTTTQNDERTVWTFGKSGIVPISYVVDPDMGGTDVSKAARPFIAFEIDH